MLREHPGQVRSLADGRGHKRWFTDDYFSLTVHYDDNGHLFMFELIWNYPTAPACIRWLDTQGAYFYEVDSGEENPETNRTPMLRKTFPPSNLTELRKRFLMAAEGLEPDIRAIVTANL